LIHDSGLVDCVTGYIDVAANNLYAISMQSLCRCSSVTRNKLTDHRPHTTLRDTASDIGPVRFTNRGQLQLLALIHDSGLAARGACYKVVVADTLYAINMQSLCRYSSVTRTKLTDHTQLGVTQHLTYSCRGLSDLQTLNTDRCLH
jgi:hypothetical protein